MLSQLSLILLVPTAFAIPSVVKIRDTPLTIPIKAHISNTPISKIIEADRARVKSFLQHAAEAKHGKPAASPINVTNAAAIYTATVGVGNPPTDYTLVVDTGSSNTWVGANKSFTPTSSTKQTGQNVMVVYGSGNFTGKEVIDTVTLAPDLVVERQSIGVATMSSGFEGVDGILGLGPSDLTVGTLSPGKKSTISTVTDNLFAQKTIASDEIAISFEPTNSESVTNGELTFGGTDKSRYTGDISYFPITKTPPSRKFWGIDQSISLGTTIILPTTAGIVDTGTTLLYIASDAFQTYQIATGGVMDVATGFLRLTPKQFLRLPSLYFTVGATTFEMTANAQAWPRKLNTFINGTNEFVYLIVSDIGAPSGQGLDFINGFTFLERFYSVYDTKHKRFGLATTQFTYATTN